MITFISLVLTIVGCLNWLSIGILQFDFVAGIFGSQSSVISRIIYVLVGIAAIMLTVNIIKEKGNLKISFKKKQTDMHALPATESAHDNAKNTKDIK